jgi:nucleoside-diphosphate-sugar epimerase
MVKTFTNDRIKKALGWTPQTTMKDGISMTLQWLLENWESATAK